MKLLTRQTILAGFLIAATGALAQTAAPAKVADTSKGKSLVDAKGMTLYIFDKDTAGKSNCNGDCAVKWPPLMAADDAADEGEFTVVTRDDGSKMWAHEGMPLYYWYEDTQPGDISGDGVGGVWHLAVD